ncbi:hypothetical protein HNQ93_001255 [Hymenobacter luteus]|uniref:TraR/DksA family transcriptional regulator n=2 Tax=Hymenobacter TaxID=89966 RepID=A0A7W9T050_9BACT|nr:MULTISPECIES: hypothetical protein [Hymenobacter]MBB4601384.1 hypothetical protein [Hymenobacter latericoloratus]MBB6058409.1 hypothetical protein [Hymenobacter luteus]
MATNLDYLDPTLQPLADKLQAYLQTEKELQRAEVKATDLTHRHQPSAPPTDYEQRSAAGSYDQPHEEIRLSLEHLRDELDRLRQEVIALLPVRDEWIKVNLGYGPSRVGAFSTTPATASPGANAAYELRVVV